MAPKPHSEASVYRTNLWLKYGLCNTGAVHRICFISPKAEVSTRDHYTVLGVVLHRWSVSGVVSAENGGVMW